MSPFFVARHPKYAAGGWYRSCLSVLEYIYFREYNEAADIILTITLWERFESCINCVRCFGIVSYVR